jgi:anti-sigma regulatory factor (Ser/Thr protein kinase)
VRADLRAFLSPEVGGEALEEIVLAVNEACSNACLHAYPVETGAISVRVANGDRTVSVEVEDSGIGIGDRTTSLGAGFGMKMMRTLSSGYELESGPSGTLVRMKFERVRGVAANGAG